MGDALSVAGTAQDWIDKIDDVRHRNHLLVRSPIRSSRSWAGVAIEGLLSLDDQIREVNDAVGPRSAELVTDCY